MSAATASIADVFRSNFTNRDEKRDGTRAGQSQTQCTPMPLPALGTQRIVQGNGTNVGTVILLQCPAKHKLVGRELTCVMDTNSTHWVGETYCKPLSPYEVYGFRVAVLASIVSSAIILLMSMAFITCCLLDCIKDDKKRKQERELDLSQWEELAQEPEDNRSRFSHKGRNNNNNNTQEKMLQLWDAGRPGVNENVRPCRCHEQYAYGPARTYGPPPPLSALPGHDYHQPLLPRNPESAAQISGPPPYFAPPLQSSCHTAASLGRVQTPAAGSGAVWQYGGQQSSVSGVRPSTTEDQRKTNRAKEFSIRIISV